MMRLRIVLTHQLYNPADEPAGKLVHEYFKIILKEYKLTTYAFHQNLTKIHISISPTRLSHNSRIVSDSNHV